MFAVYKGKLHPLYAEKSNKKFKCFIKNKQIHFVRNDTNNESKNLKCSLKCTIFLIYDFSR